MRATVLAIAGLIAASASAPGQVPDPCADPSALPIDSLRALARTLHADALTEARRRDGMIIALVFDANCRLTHHTVSRRSMDALDGGVDGTLRALFPTAGIASTRFGGIADAIAHAPMAPWIVWGVRDRPYIKRLEPADFVVAGIPDDVQEMDVEKDTARARRILGAPLRVRRHEFMPGDSMTTWHYDGLEFTFGSIARQGITLTSPRIRTTRGLAVGDSSYRVMDLYGLPQQVMEDQWVYQDPREELHVITVTIRAGRVASIYIGSLWD